MLGDLIPEDHLDANGICRIVEPLLREHYSASVAEGLIPKPGNLMEPVRNGLAYRRVPRGADFREGGRAAEVLLEAAAADPEPTSPPAKRRLIDLEDLENEPPPRWIVPNAVPAEGVTVVYGPPKAGKSLIVADIAASVAAGTRWCDNVACECEGTVVFFALEARRPTAARLQAWKKARGADTRRRLKFADAGFLLDDKGGVPKLADVAAALREECGGAPALIVVDTWAHLMGLWGLDENKTADQNIAAKWWERLAEELGTPILIVAHSGKEDRGIRGSNALEATAAAVLGVEIERRTVRIRTRAMRSAELGWHMVATIGTIDDQPVLTGLTADMSEEEDFPDEPIHDTVVGPDDRTLQTAIVETLDQLAKRGLADARLNDVAETIAAKVSEGPRSRKAAAERAKVILRRIGLVHNGRCDVLPGPEVREMIGRKNE